MWAVRIAHAATVCGIIASMPSVHHLLTICSARWRTLCALFWIPKSRSQTRGTRPTVFLPNFSAISAVSRFVVSSAIFSGSSMPRRTAFVGSMLLTPVLVDVSNRYGLAVPGPVLNEAM